MTDQTRPAGVGLDVRLAVTSDIVRAMLDGQPPDRIVQVAVESLHAHFPHLRSAYATVDPDGRISVERSAGLAWPSSAGAMVLPGPAMEMLRARDLITIADTDIGADSAIDALTDIGGNITSDVLRAGFAAVNIRALLDAPIHHSEKLVGLLSLDSSTPYQWSDHEQTTLREAADFLCVALRDADARRRLEDSELKFRLLAESSHAMIALLQKEGAVYLNPELMRLTGYSHDALMQTSLWDLSSPGRPRHDPVVSGPSSP